MPLQVLLVLITLDYITGLIKGVVHQNLSSEVGRKGLFRKGSIFVILILAVLLDRLLENDTWLFRTVVCYFYIANEGISIIENCASSGLPIPKKIINTLEQLKDYDKDK